jgi:hypothetical protein
MTAEKKLADFIEMAEKYISDNDLGIKSDINPLVVDHVKNLLGMSAEAMYDLDLDKINQYSIMISQYCMYMQDVRNKLDNTIMWCDYYINSELATEWKNPEYEFIPKDMKKHSISKSNSFVDSLMKIRLTAQSRLNGIPEDMDNLRSIAYRIGQIK